MGKDDETICFCFGHTKKDIADDLKRNGKSLILEKIVSEKARGGCSCSLKNPKGR